MLYSDSRYADGYFYKAQRAQDGSFQTTVDRRFPNVTSSFFYYDWLEGDRIDLVANKIYGDPSYWWKIMDFNPEVMDATNIPSGTTLRIPND
jgi:hypothetical protein